jgi:hypothetical protein
MILDADESLRLLTLGADESLHPLMLDADESLHPLTLDDYSSSYNPLLFYNFSDRDHNFPQIMNFFIAINKSKNAI